MAAAGGAGPNPANWRREAMGAVIEEHAGEVGTPLWGLGRDGSSPKERSMATRLTDGKHAMSARTSHRGA
jgi:hypothetical protein